MSGCWLAEAEYPDGTGISQRFEDDPRKRETDQQYELECWLVERETPPIWYSVRWISDEER